MHPSAMFPSSLGLLAAASATGHELLAQTTNNTSMGLVTTGAAFTASVSALAFVVRSLLKGTLVAKPIHETLEELKELNEEAARRETQMLQLIELLVSNTEPDKPSSG